MYAIYVCFLLFSNRCAYFNTFYNAEESFSKAVKIIQNAPILEDNKLPSESIVLLNKVISNCDVVINEYPNSKYVDKAYFLKGVSYFYKKSYDLSIDNLSFLIDKNSIYFDQAILWSTYSLLRLSNFEKSDSYLAKIKSQDLNNDDLYIFYNIHAELSEIKSDMVNAYKYYILASDVTSNDSRKIYIYRKLIHLSDLSGDLESKNKFIELLEPYIDNQTELRKLKIDWIDGKKSSGQFNDIIEEVDNIIDQPDFQLIKPKLLLYKSKAYQQLNRLKASKDILNQIVNEYSRKDETSEAYYILGNLSLFNEFDLDKTKEYYQKSVDEKSRSDHAKMAKTIKSKIEKYENLITDIEYFSENSSIDTADVEVDLNDMNMSKPKIQGEVKIDSLIFEIGQIFYFDFNKVDSAMFRYQYILDKYPNSIYRNQINKILTYNNSQDLVEVNGDNILENDDFLLSKRDDAWSIESMLSQRDYYKSIYKTYGDSIALFNVAYIEDKFLYNTKEAVLIYSKIAQDYSTHPNLEYIDERLSEIKIDVNNLLKENNFNLRFNDALTLLNTFQLDSARNVLENIVVSRKSRMYETVNSLILNIDLYRKLQENYNDNKSDSLIYEMGEIEYYYFYNDLDSKEKMIEIVDNYSQSKYKHGATWILNKKFDESYSLDSLDYSLIDTSMSRLENPVYNLDIKIARADSIKLDDILLYLENGK